MAERESELVEQYIDLVPKVARRRFASRLPDDDLIQAGNIGLWEAAKRWSGNCEFEKFAKVCIYHNMLDHVRSGNTKQRERETELQDDDGEEDGEEPYFDELAVMELCDDINKAWPRRDSKENKVLTMLAVGYDKRACADVLGLDVPQVSRIAKRAYRRFNEQIRALEQKGTTED